MPLRWNNCLHLARVSAACAVFLMPQALQAQSLSGAYLAAAVADMNHDFDQAALYYTRAMALDPQAENLPLQSLLSFLAKGDIKTADVLAKRIEEGGFLATLMRVATLMKAGNHDEAIALLSARPDDIHPALREPLLAWLELGAGQATQAMERLERMSDDPQTALLGNSIRALALAYLGNLPEALQVVEENGLDNFSLTEGQLRSTIEIISEGGDLERALQKARTLREGEIQRALIKTLEAGETPEYSYITSPQDGMAEVLYLFSALSDRDEEEVYRLIYSRLALHLRPDLEENTLFIAQALHAFDEDDLAVPSYQSIPTHSPFYKEGQYGLAELYRDMNANAEAIETAGRLIAYAPDDLATWALRGEIHLAEKNYAQAIEDLSAAIERIPPEREAALWFLFYSRGIAYERAKNWDAAEADFRHALTLAPEQAEVMNYLGYSLLDMGIKLDDAEALIQKAAANAPQNGYIIDSLAWLYFKTGQYEKAVEPMERAIALVADDPIMNDHLGDIYWKVGRQREATFQWRRALSFEPEPELADIIRQKIENGYPDDE